MQEPEPNFMHSERPTLPSRAVMALQALEPSVAHLLHTAGWHLLRAERGFVWTERGRVLGVSTEELDPDDTLLQIAFHEAMHGLVEGPEARWLDDWGLCNEDASDLPHEHAALVLQAHIADAWGLREALAPTTDHWTFYHALPSGPMLTQALLDAHAQPEAAPEHLFLAARAQWRWHRWGHRHAWERVLRALQCSLSDAGARDTSPHHGSTAAGW